MPSCGSVNKTLANMQAYRMLAPHETTDTRSESTASRRKPTGSRRKRTGNDNLKRESLADVGHGIAKILIGHVDQCEADHALFAVEHDA